MDDKKIPETNGRFVLSRGNVCGPLRQVKRRSWGGEQGDSVGARTAKFGQAKAETRPGKPGKRQEFLRHPHPGAWAFFRKPSLKSLRPPKSNTTAMLRPPSSSWLTEVLHVFGGRAPRLQESAVCGGSFGTQEFLGCAVYELPSISWVVRPWY